MIPGSATNPGMADSTTLMTVRDLKTLEARSSVPFTSVLLVRKVTAKTSKNDSPYLSVELGDKTGAFSVTCFSDSPLFEFFKNLPESDVVRIEADRKSTRLNSSH